MKFLKKACDLEAVGVGGVINFLVSELNDLYSGCATAQAWGANFARL